MDIVIKKSKTYLIFHTIIFIGSITSSCIMHSMYSSLVKQLPNQSRKTTPMAPLHNISHYKDILTQWHSPSGLFENKFSLDVKVTCRYQKIRDKPDIEISRNVEDIIVSGISFNTGSQNEPMLSVESNMRIGLGWYTDSKGKMQPALSIENADNNGLFCVAVNAKQIFNPFSWLKKNKTKSTVILQNKMSVPNSFTKSTVGSSFLASCIIGSIGEEFSTIMTRTNENESISPGFIFTKGDTPLLELKTMMQANFGIYKNENGKPHLSFSLMNRDKTGAVCIAINPQKFLSLSDWSDYLIKEGKIQPYQLPEPNPATFAP